MFSGSKTNIFSCCNRILCFSCLRSLMLNRFYKLKRQMIIVVLDINTFYLSVLYCFDFLICLYISDYTFIIYV